ncbi:hypothetical protein GCM10010923_00700 [Blastomonas marina]|uniref:Uncharacterized protein n=1 Tax=Blastomonas marina TaxID=1867408 RepID=A0ABQ1F176_9SPHN|nr:hypothetical protein GCM10010923_00700 [Blastomonas marina]
MLVAAAVADLDHTQPVAAGDQAHRLGIDRERAGAFEDAFGEVFFMKVNSHMRVALRPAFSAGKHERALAMAGNEG